MKPTVKHVLAGCIGVLAILVGMEVVIPSAPPAPAPQAPQPPTVTTHVDEANQGVCWVASSPHGVAISCVSTRPVGFEP